MPRKKTSEEEEIQETDSIKAVPDPSPLNNQPASTGSPQEKQAWVREEMPSVKKRPEPSEVKIQDSDEPGITPVSDHDAHTWAMLAHLSVLLNLISGWLGILAALIIYLVYKDRSRLVAYHAMQSLIFQAITWIGAGILSGILISFGSALSFLVIPLLCLIPGFLILLLPPASLIYGIIGAVKVNNGEDFRYWQVGDWVRGILELESK